MGLLRRVAKGVCNLFFKSVAFHRSTRKVLGNINNKNLQNLDQHEENRRDFEKSTRPTIKSKVKLSSTGAIDEARPALED